MSKKKFDPTDTKQITDELDQSAFFRPQPLPDPVTHPSSSSANAEMQKPISELKEEKQENKETSFPENKETRKQEILETRNLGNKKTRNLVSQESNKRSLFPKFTYQLDPEVIDLLEDTKRTLRRSYGLKVLLAEIVEEGIKAMCHDVEENKETSVLVQKFSRNQENKET